MAFRFTRLEFLGIAVGAASGSLVFGALPFVVGAAISTFGNPASAGLAASAELAAMGAASVGVSAMLRRLPGRATAITMVLVLVLAQVLSEVAVLQKSWSLFIAARVIAGASEGALYTIANAFAARSDRPDRAFTLIAFAQTFTTASFFTVMAYVNQSYDPAGTFRLFTIFAALTVLPIAMIPRCTITAESSGQEEVPRRQFSLAAKMVLAGFAFYSIALYMLFPYVEDIGVKAGFTHSQVASALAASAVTSLAGPAIAVYCGSRFGRFWPILVSVMVQIAAILIIVYSRNMLLWGGAEVISVTMIYILNPMLFGLAAHVDRSGRTAALSGAVMALTAAIGPAISSFVLTVNSSYVFLGWINAAIFVVFIALIFRHLRIADRETRLERKAHRVPLRTPVDSMA